MITSAYEIPNLRFSLPAYGNVARHRFVQIKYDEDDGAYDGSGMQAHGGQQVIGVSMNQAANGEVLEIADGLVIVEAGAPITGGSFVIPDSEGRAIPTNGFSGAFAMTGAAAAGEFITVKLYSVTL
jgi:hypothetical protein